MHFLKNVSRNLKVLDRFKNVSVVGAGTMGIGIAEVAAVHGHNVKVFDLNHEFAQSSLSKVKSRYSSRVERGKISQAQMDDILQRIEIVDDLKDLSQSNLVIEAIVEKLEIKQKLFKELEEICSEETLLASNTSSISITAIASILMKPERMIGLHFFNPAPIMKLVEVISGLKSSNESMESGVAICQFWNKVAVKAKSTPGFIVNRVARPFYGEALKMLQEGVASIEQVDAIIRNSGFRMGPFQLMDLIGIDVNLAVSKTVYETMFYDPRYKPSLIQQEMVHAKLLGKKTGRGFYSYEGDSNTKNILNFEQSQQAPKNVSINQAKTPLSEMFKSSAYFSDFEVSEHSGKADLHIADCEVSICNGQTAEGLHLNEKSKHFCHVDLVLSYEECEFLVISFNKDCPKSTQNLVIGFFQKLNKKVLLVKDTPGMIVMRIVSMLINEAADAVDQGVCTEQDVDLAMKYGVNYPSGLLQWSESIGHQNVLTVLNHLFGWFGDDRYRVASWLRLNY